MSAPLWHTVPVGNSSLTDVRSMWWEEEEEESEQLPSKSQKL